MAIAEIIQKCKTTLEGYYGSQFKGLILYGSAARDQADPGSDIDLLVLLSQPFNYFDELRQIIEVLYPIQLESDWLISAKPAPLDEFEEGRIRLSKREKRRSASVTLPYADEIAANLERAEQSIQAARQLASGGYYDFAASRAYYAATAVLLGEGLEFSKHSDEADPPSASLQAGGLSRVRSASEIRMKRKDRVGLSHEDDKDCFTNPVEPLSLDVEEL